MSTATPTQPAQPLPQNAAAGQPGHDKSPRTGRTILLAASWIALVTGFAEVGYWMTKRHVLGRLVFMPDGLPWMTPTAHLVLFAAASVPLMLLVRFVRRQDRLPFAVTLLASPSKSLRAPIITTCDTPRRGAAPAAVTT